MSFLEKSNIQKWIEIVISSIFLSMIPFAILWSNYGFYDIFYLFTVIGLSIGVFWAERVRKKRGFEDYSSDALMRTPDMIETWEKEDMKFKKKILIILIVNYRDEGGGISPKTIEMFTLPFSLESEIRYQLIDDLISEGYVEAIDLRYKTTSKAKLLLKTENIEMKMNSFLTVRSKVTLEFLLTKWREDND
jgi:hypothetical protein